MPGHGNMLRGKALWYVDCGRAELREETIAKPEQDALLVRALFSALSRGTERLVYSGRVPASEHERMRCPRMGGAFPFPVKYGYALVGRVEAGPAELGNCPIFSTQPHHDVFTTALNDA